MSGYFYLIPIAIALGLAALAAFLWSLRSGQYEDLAGAAERILFEDGDRPIVAGAKPGAAGRPPGGADATH